MCHVGSKLKCFPGTVSQNINYKKEKKNKNITSYGIIDTYYKNQSI